MCDDKDHVIEGTMSNIFLVKNNNLYTPNLDFCGIDGIMRNIVIKIAKSKNSNSWKNDICIFAFTINDWKV